MYEITMDRLERLVVLLAEENTVLKDDAKRYREYWTNEMAAHSETQRQLEQLRNKLMDAGYAGDQDTD